MKGLSEDHRSLEDATGRLYPIRGVVIALTDTLVRTLGLVLILCAIGLIWEALH